MLNYILTSALKLDNIKENTKKQAASKHHKSPSKKPLPLRTSTQVCEFQKKNYLSVLIKMGDHIGIRKKLQPQLPDIEMYSPPQYAVKTKKQHASPMHANFQSHGLQSHESILGEASPKVQVSFEITDLLTALLCEPQAIRNQTEIY